MGLGRLSRLSLRMEIVLKVLEQNLQVPSEINAIMSATILGKFLNFHINFVYGRRQKIFFGWATFFPSLNIIVSKSIKLNKKFINI